MSRHLAAILACRNSGSRLYGKPLQRLDIQSGWRVLDQVIANLKRFDFIEHVVPAISVGSENIIYEEYAHQKGLPFVTGDEHDVLQRLLMGLDLVNATDLIRVTTESPFLYWEVIEGAWANHVKHGYDATFMDGIVDGCGFEIVKASAMRESWRRGNSRHRSELCTLFIRENRTEFLISQLFEPPLLCRNDLRLTVDYPEDLIVCRSVYKHLSETGTIGNYNILDIIKFLDHSPDLARLIYPLSELGYKTMYL